MGGSAGLIATVFSSVLGTVAGQSKKDDSGRLEKERRKAQLQEEAEERRRDREKVLEARQLEKKRGESLLSGGAASLVDDPDVSAKTLKNKLGE